MEDVDISRIAGNLDLHTSLTYSQLPRTASGATGCSIFSTTQVFFPHCGHLLKLHTLTPEGATYLRALDTTQNLLATLVTTANNVTITAGLLPRNTYLSSTQPCINFRIHLIQL